VGGGLLEQEMGNRLLASAVVLLMSRVTLTLSHSFSWRGLSFFICPMFASAHASEQSFTQEFAQFGILLAEVLGDFAEFPSEGNLRVERRGYLSDASCRFVTIALHGAASRSAQMPLVMLQFTAQSEFEFFEGGFFLLFVFAFGMSRCSQVSDDGQQLLRL
jgi:hypothetical protein